MARSGLLFVSTLLTFVVSEYLPPKFEPCNPADSKCLKIQAQNMIPFMACGIPEIGSKSLDPVILTKTTFSLAGLTMNITQGQVFGITEALIDYVKLDTENKFLEFLYHHDVVMNGKYSANGRLIILPITGAGDMSATLKHLNIKVNAPFDIIKGDGGKEYMKLKSFKIKSWIKGNENARFKLTGLFGGNKQLATALEAFINENGELLTNDLAGPIIEATFKVAYKQIKKFFDANPYETVVKHN